MFSYYSLSAVDTVLNISTFWIYATQYTLSTTSTCLLAVDKEYSRAITFLLRLGYFEFPGISNSSFFPYTLNQSRYLRGVTTLINAVSGQSHNCSGNLEISPGIGTLANFSGKHAIVPEHCRKTSGHRRKFYFMSLFRLTSVS